MHLSTLNRSLIFFALSLFFLTSCKREVDKCANVTCVNGSCEAGICVCKNGYDGTACDSEIRRKFLLHWYAHDTITTTNIPETEYFSEIIADTGISNVTIQSIFDDYCWDVTATIQNDTITVTNGNLCSGNKLSGKAVLKDKYLYWHYSLVTSNGDTIQYRGTWQGY